MISLNPRALRSRSHECLSLLPKTLKRSVFFLEAVKIVNGPLLRAFLIWQTLHKTSCILIQDYFGNEKITYMRFVQF